MPIIRKVIKAGPNSFAVTLPKTWLDLLERQTGEKITEVTLEVNGKITIEPLLNQSKIVKKANKETLLQ
jgi:antitoxin component of MazEF toxin-antitoxin module